MKKHETNTQFIRRLMEHTILGQVFIIEAIRRYAAAVHDRGRDQVVADFADGMIDGGAWFDTAEELHVAIATRNR